MNKDDFLSAAAALELLQDGTDIPVPPVLDELGVTSLLEKNDASVSSVRDVVRLLRMAARMDRVFSAQLPWNPQMILFGATATHGGGTDSPYSGEGAPTSTDYGSVGFSTFQAFCACIGEAAEHDAMLMRRNDRRIGQDGKIDLQTADFSPAGATDARSILRAAGSTALAHPRTSTGYAAGPDLRQAARSAMFECVERHALALWFSRECGLTELMPSSTSGTVWEEHLRFYGDDLKFYLIDHDLDKIPVVIAVSRMADGEIVAGYGCAGDEQGAAFKAYREACQNEFGLQLDLHNARVAKGSSKGPFVHLARSAMFKAQPALFACISRRKMKKEPSLPVAALATAIPDLNLVDLTVSEVGIPVVCALAPRLRDITAERQGRIPWPV